MIVSHGGGVQTTALLALAATGEIPHRTFVFANVGDRAEKPETLAYLRNVAAPFAERHGLTLTERRWVTRVGTPRDLFDDLTDPDTRSWPIPVQGGNRLCTIRYKIAVVNRWMRENGATPSDPMRVAIGFSVDEIDRARTPGVDPNVPYRIVEYPLIDLEITRAQCHRIIAAADLPDPPRSSCWFCPLQSTAEWRHTRATDPHRFTAAVALEATINRRRAELHRRPMFLHGDAPLDVSVDDQLQLPGFGCTDGACAT